jgi:hypothetical protein
MAKIKQITFGGILNGAAGLLLSGGWWPEIYTNIYNSTAVRGAPDGLETYRRNAPYYCRFLNVKRISRLVIRLAFLFSAVSPFAFCG